MRKQTKRKCVGYFIASTVGIFLASMTSHTNRIYLKHTIQYYVGNEVVVESGNGEAINGVEEEEDLVRQNIQQSLGIPVPVFMYRPDGQKGVEYSIELGNAAAAIEYSYENTILNLYMLNENRADISEEGIHGEKIKETSIMKGTIRVHIRKVKGPEDKQATMLAFWRYTKGYYKLSGKVDEEEFLKIVKAIYY